VRGLDPQRERSAIVRHLVMPGLVDETEAILDRRPHREELERAFEIADALELRRLHLRNRRQALAAA
jgi:uncharacterized Fe-S radical SAM superfamily protein PflX